MTAPVDTKRYIGDSVYVEFIGHAIVLTTSNGLGDSNRIVLEPEVAVRLRDYCQSIINHWQGGR